MNEANVKSGFSSTGIWPVNKDKYPMHRFDPRLLRKYEEWQESGGTVLNWDELANNKLDEAIPMAHNLLPPVQTSVYQPTSSTATRIDTEEYGNTSQLQSVANISLQTQRDVTSSPAAKGTINATLSLKRYSGPHPYDAPEGFQWVPNGWKLEKMSDNNKRTNNKTFDELFLDKIKGPVNKTKQTRQRIDLRAQVV